MERITQWGGTAWTSSEMWKFKGVYLLCKDRGCVVHRDGSEGRSLRKTGRSQLLREPNMRLESPWGRDEVVALFCFVLFGLKVKSFYLERPK